MCILCTPSSLFFWTDGGLDVTDIGIYQLLFFWLVILFLFVQVIDILLKMIYILVLFARFVSQRRPRDILERILIIYDYICACKISIFKSLFPWVLARGLYWKTKTSKLKTYIDATS